MIAPAVPDFVEGEASGVRPGERLVGDGGRWRFGREEIERGAVVRISRQGAGRDRQVCL
jgi:hypothetical protein